MYYVYGILGIIYCTLITNDAYYTQVVIHVCKRIPKFDVRAQHIHTLIVDTSLFVQHTINSIIASKKWLFL